MIMLQEALRKEKKCKEDATRSLGRVLAATLGTRLPLSPSLLAAGSSRNRGGFSFFPLRVISLQDRPLKKEKKGRHQHNTRNPDRTLPRGTWSSSRISACSSSSCALRPCSPCPHVSCAPLRRGGSPVAVRRGFWLRCEVRRPALARCHAVLLVQLWVLMAKHL